MRAELFSTDHRHTNTDSDSEVLLNVFAHELERATRGLPLESEAILPQCAPYTSAFVAPMPWWR